jgi:hypothetical protein
VRALRKLHKAIGAKLLSRGILSSLFIPLLQSIIMEGQKGGAGEGEGGKRKHFVPGSTLALKEQSNLDTQTNMVRNHNSKAVITVVMIIMNLYYYVLRQMTMIIAHGHNNNSKSSACHSVIVRTVCVVFGTLLWFVIRP